MNLQVRAMWAAALRSGDYPQGTGNLRAYGRFCPLGVLCELAVQAGVIPPPTKGQNIWAYGADHGESRTSYLPDAVTRWAGLGDDDPAVLAPGGRFLPLSHLNDAGMTFAEIADLIDGGETP
jgi:hypothetical protein